MKFIILLILLCTVFIFGKFILSIIKNRSNKKIRKEDILVSRFMESHKSDDTEENDETTFLGNMCNAPMPSGSQPENKTSNSELINLIRQYKNRGNKGNDNK